MMNILLILSLLNSYPTDLALLRRAVDKALRGMREIKDAKEISILSEEREEGDWIVRDGLTQFFENRGFTLFSTPRENSLQLHYRTIELKIFYTRRIKRWPWSNPIIERRAQAEFIVRLLKDGRFINSQNLSGIVIDRVPEKELPFLRSEPFSPQTSIPKSFNLWEPLLVAGIVVVLVITFYTPSPF